MPMTTVKPQNISQEANGATADRDRLRRETQERIRFLRRQLRMGMLGMVIFTALSAIAMLNARLLPPLSEKTRQFLGPSPPPTLISIALVVYVFSALTLILARMNREFGTYRGWSHLGYLTSFYVFYYYAGELGESFWAVFVAGLTILGLENYRIWTSCSEALRDEEEILASLGD